MNKNGPQKSLIFMERTARQGWRAENHRRPVQQTGPRAVPRAMPSAQHIATRWPRSSWGREAHDKITPDPAGGQRSNKADSGRSVNSCGKCTPPHSWIPPSKMPRKQAHAAAIMWVWDEGTGESNSNANMRAFLTASACAEERSTFPRRMEVLTCSGSVSAFVTSAFGDEGWQAGLLAVRSGHTSFRSVREYDPHRRPVRRTGLRSRGASALMACQKAAMTCDGSAPRTATEDSFIGGVSTEPFMLRCPLLSLSQN